MIPLSKNPPSRYPERSILEAEHRWWVAKIKSRQEKALAGDLLERKIEYFLPMYTKVTRRNDNNKPRKTILCLFPGYISFCPHKGFEREVFATNRVINLVEVRNQKRFMNQLEQIYLAFNRGISLQPIDNSEEYDIGQEVTVTSGPMYGLRGTIARIQSKHKLILSVEMLGKAAISIDTALVKSAEGAA